MYIQNLGAKHDATIENQDNAQAIRSLKVFVTMLNKKLNERGLKHFAHYFGAEEILEAFYLAVINETKYKFVTQDLADKAVEQSKQKANTLKTK